MSTLMIPAVVRAKAEAAGAGAWLRTLPSLVADLEMEWAISVGAVFEDATEALVAAVELADGTPSVLKLIVPRAGDAARHEIAALRLMDGRGAARLLRSDEGRGALLLERLGPSMFAAGLPVDRRHEILCALAIATWRPAAGLGFPTGAEKGRWLIDHITRSWEELGRPCGERAVADAVACAERRIAAFDEAKAVLVHGDVHQWNALAAAGGAYKLVDPDGLFAEPEYDLGVIMREDPVDLLRGDPWERARRLAAWSGRDATATWEWGVVERVSTGLICTRIGLQPVGREMLAAADAVAGG